MLVALLLFTPACVSAQPRAAHPALFVVRDADSTLYIFGAVHVRPPGEPWGGREAQDALAASDEVWTEIDISPEADAQALTLIRSIGFAPRDRPLSSWLTPEENTRLTALAERLGVAPSMLNAMQPWLAAITLSMAPMTQAGFDPASGVDRAVDAAADAAGKRRRAFETIEQQLRFVANVSPEAQHQMLLDAIDEAEQGPAELRQLSAAWERGDLSRIERLVVTEMREKYPELYEVLFRQRNAAWVETLMHEMQGSGTDFIAVGAGHLVGADGLVAQLRARGLRVERVSARD